MESKMGSGIVCLLMGEIKACLYYEDKYLEKINKVKRRVRAGIGIRVDVKEMRR